VPLVGKVFFPLDKVLEVDSSYWSEGVQKGVSRLGARSSFAEAAADYLALTGVEISAKSVERVTERNGKRLGEVQAEELEEAFREEPLPAPGPSEKEEEKRWGVSLDGTMVNIRGEGWHEVKIGTVFSFHEEKLKKEEAERKKRGTVVRMKDISYRAGLWNSEEMGQALWAETSKRGLESKEIEAGVADGSGWIWNQIQTNYGWATQIVDWYHVSERVWLVGNTVYGEGKKKTKGWVEERLDLLWEGESGEVIENIEKLKVRGKEKQKVVGEALTYLRNQQERGRLRYKYFRDRGLPIGSGSVESGCKNVVGARCKRSGMRWSRGGVQKVLNLRAELLSGRWDEAWDALWQKAA
jgi:hypothetical protein